MPFNSEPMPHAADDHRRCTIVFVRAPEPGKVKTRLAKVLRKDVVLDLYKCFTTDLLETLCSTGTTIKVCYHPTGLRAMVENWLGRVFVYHPQRGRDLGERMANAFRRVFSEGFNQALLVGTDLPDLPGTVIHDAFEGLCTHDSVIGPSIDGGYYLIGFNAASFLPTVFEGMTWGSRHIFEQTLSRFNDRRHRYCLLPKWHDIDDYADLAAFIERNAGDKNMAQNTLEYLRRSGMIRFSDGRQVWPEIPGADSTDEGG